MGGVTDRTLSEQLADVEGQLESTKSELCSCRKRMENLLQEKSSADLEVEELRAELNLLQAKLRRAEHSPRGRTPDVRLSPHISTSTDSPRHPRTREGPLVTLTPQGMGSSVLRPEAPVFHGTPPLDAPHPQMDTTLHPAAPSLLSMGQTVVPQPPGALPPPTSSALPDPHGDASLPHLLSEPEPSAFPVPMSMASGLPVLTPPPQLSRFSGEEGADGETFNDWIEQFDSVARLAMWDGHYKLVHPTNWLKGPALSFFRSYPLEQQSDYSRLVEALRKRFMPVHLASVSTQLFHERRQSERESVDEYAQELQQLFRRAYVGVMTGGPGGEVVGQRLLANQFSVGSQSELKAKVVGHEGSLDQLLVKAKFEEAKLRDLAKTKGYVPQNKFTNPMKGPAKDAAKGAVTSLDKTSSKGTGGTDGSSKFASQKCFNCGLEGHMARACPYPKKTNSSKEAHGRAEKVVSATIPTKPDTPSQQKIAELRRKLQEAKLAAAVEETAGALTTVRSSEGSVSRLFVLQYF